jgi:hypothetical protein
MRLLVPLMVFTMPLAAVVVKETVIRYTEEHINGVVFKVRSDLTNGVLTERKAINDKQVSPDEFAQQKETALLADIRRQREEDENKRRQQETQDADQQIFNQRARCAIFKKQIALLVKDVEQELGRMRKQTLDSYVTFEDPVISSREQFEDIERVVIPSAKTLLSADNLTELELNSMIRRLEKIPDSLRRLSQSTITHAINKSDDTKLLKELLNMVN